MATIKDISIACGVSPATVSKALNGYSDISEETIRLVQRKANELHYMPNAAARLLKTNSSHNIGVVFVDDTMSGLTHEYFSLILNSVKEEAESLGYDITFISQSLGAQKLTFLQHCRYRKCDGVVIASVNFQNESVIELADSSIPVVTIDYAFRHNSSVLSDNESGEYELTKHMILAGHRRIAFIHGEQTQVTAGRLKGYHKAMAEHGLPVSEELLQEARYHDPDSVRRATGTLLDLHEPPTAILFPDDYSYLGGLAVIRERGLSIPDDLSVAGYDGINLSQVLSPALTTWYQDADAIGRQSVRRLVEDIRMKGTGDGEQIMVSGRLQQGGSVAAPRSS